MNLRRADLAPEIGHLLSDRTAQHRHGLVSTAPFRKLACSYGAAPGLFRPWLDQSKSPPVPGRSGGPGRIR